jgi:hypothetical protein
MARDYYPPRTGWLAERSGTGNAPTKKLSNEPEKIEPGQWYWIKDDDGVPWLGCVMRLGSNYVKLRAPSGADTRIHIDRFDDVCTRELNAASIMAGYVEQHKQAAARLIGEIKQLTSNLGIGPRDTLAQGEAPQTALAVAHGTANIEAHKDALVLAQTKTLPELFKQVEAEHESMSAWMKGQLLPALADLEGMKKAANGIGDRIFTVELYAGLVESVRQIVDGAPASIDDKVHLFQRRHYMDEECLANYTAGGMDISSLDKFDAWLVKPENLDRILPMPRCIVAFQVRRREKEREVNDLRGFIKAMYMAESDKATFLYIRNGAQVFRLNTAIDFGEQLFPDRDHEDLLSAGTIYIGHFDHVISQRAYTDMLIEEKKERKAFAEKMHAWKEAGKPEHKRPWPEPRRESEYYRPCTPDDVRYDDGMAKVSKVARDHNRVAVVLQGLLDRSPTLHPHPPWRLWTPEGFTAGVELVYDTTRGLVDGPAPDFEAYRVKLNAGIKRGAMTVGQEDAWMRHEGDKENERRRANSYGGWHEVTRVRPYGNPGPGLIAPVVKLSRDGKASFSWLRERMHSSGYGSRRKQAGDKILTHFSCQLSELLNVSAYKAGDYKIFYADPRTRADYLEWAPLLLAAEDYVNGKGEMFSAVSDADRASDQDDDEPESDANFADADNDDDEDGDRDSDQDGDSGEDE